MVDLKIGCRYRLAYNGDDVTVWQLSSGDALVEQPDGHMSWVPRDELEPVRTGK